MSNVAPDIAGKVYIITGASRGVGHAVCKALHARGARIALLARTLEEIQAHATEFGERAFAVRCDVGSRDDCFAAVKEVAGHFGGVDGLVNNAGVAKIAPVEKILEDDLTQMFRINVLGTMFMIQAVLPELRKRGGGHILNISSVSVRDPSEFPFTGGYTCSKAALERLTQELRTEVSAENIAVTLFSLGSTLTYFGVGWDPEITAAAFAEWIARGGVAPQTMDPSIPAEQIVRCFEMPPSACFDFIQFRPYATMEKGRQMAG
jgi:NAD(P)-dependent dehydrogenase (short-subunit alcohol dehydrogenase family)